MHSRLTSLGLSICLLAAVVPAAAAPNDADVLELAEEAITIDYLSTKFEQAEAKLLKALTLCPGQACSDSVKAQIHRDLGVIYVAGLQDYERGRAQFSEALAIDPKIALDKDLETEDVRKAFEEAAANLGITPQSSETVDRAPKVRQPEPKAAAPTPTGTAGDLIHTPPAEQMVSTPVPIYVEPAEGLSFSKVKIRYKPWGGDYKALEMTRVKEGYGIEVPCLDVSASGELQYYLQAYDAAGDIESESGSREQPHVVRIVNELSGDPPHLPGSAPPARCATATECPPDFPGCEDPLTEDELRSPETVDDEAALNWLSLSMHQDFLFLSGGNTICAEESDFQCFDGDDFYSGIPDDDAQGEITSGPSLATTRLLLGYDRIVAGNIALGTRLGLAFGGGPQAPDGAAFVPVHGEARVGYWFGGDPFSRDGFRPYVQLSGGVAQVDASVRVIIFDADVYGEQPAELDAWRKTGTVFGSLGGGVAYALAKEHQLDLGLRLMQMFGQSGTVLALSLGYGFGL